MAKTLALLAAAAVLAALPAGCVRPPREDAARTAATAGGADRAVIGYLRMPDGMVTILSGGPRFTVEDLQGRPIAENVSLEGLQASDPAAAGVFRRGIAEDAALDARLWRPDHMGGREVISEAFEKD